jgi:hypothetical protein
MKRFLIFTLVGPLVGVLVASVLYIWGFKELYSLYWMLRVLVSAAYTFSLFIVLTALLAWGCDLLLIHWEVKLPIRMLTIGGGVAVLATGLDTKLRLEMIVAGAMCGTIAAFCVWLSAHEFK